MVAPLILAPPGPELTAQEADFFREVDPWGFIVFARNLESADQIRRLTNDLRDSVGRDAPVLIDQEGGRVQRIWSPLASDWLPPLDDVTRLGGHAARGMYLRYRIIAAELLALGIDTNCAPTLDIARPETHPFLRNRCLGTDRAKVSAIGHAVAGGLLDGGVLPVIKHIPGHGRSRVDSHLDLPRSDTPRDELLQDDFTPFRALGDMPLAMTAHLVFDAIDPVHPATQSPAVIDLIRNEISFEGLLLTDDISMNALNGDVPTRAVAAWKAGCEMVLHCNGDLAEMRALADVVPQMQKDTIRRAEAALNARITPQPVKIAELRAQYDALG